MKRSLNDLSDLVLVGKLSGKLGVCSNASADGVKDNELREGQGQRDGSALKSTSCFC